MTEFAESTCLKYLSFLWKCAIYTILVNKRIDPLGIEEVLNTLSILPLPIAVGTTPLVVEGDIHRYTPRVIAEIVASVATASEALHLTPIVLTHIGV